VYWNICFGRMNAMADDVGVSTNKKVTKADFTPLKNHCMQYIIMYRHNICYYKSVCLFHLLVISAVRILVFNERWIMIDFFWKIADSNSISILFVIKFAVTTDQSC